MKNHYSSLTILLSASLLSACGGGGGGSASNSPAGGQSAGSGNTLTGRFVDGPVANLRYSTSTQSGRTNANGEFQYRAGETVSFFVGDILIGQAAGAATISPFTLAGTTPPASAKEITLAVRQTNRNVLPFPSSRATPLQVAANISAFLQTLDEDGNPDNGQQIPNTAHALAAGKNIDFNQPFKNFKSDKTLRSLLAAGRAAGVWGGTRAVRNQITALTTLYNGIGITPEVQAQTAAAQDVNDDGSVQTRIQYTYGNPQGLTKEEYFNTAGANTVNVTYAYDASGNLTSVEEDTNADGVPDQITRYTYDADGMLTSQNHSTGGKTDATINYTYDADGNLSGKTEVGVDTTGKPFFRASTYTYNADRTRARDEVDTDRDGTPNSITTYTYNAQGRVATVVTDSNADGQEDTRDAFTYDAHGNVTRQEGSGNGKTYVITSTYDAEGNQLDQTLNGKKVSTYAYDPANGNLVKWTNFKEDGSVRFAFTYTYTTVGNLGAAGWL